jgi:phage baseplate assembly protein W
MIGIDRHSGRALEGLEHLRQSIIDILTTPIGSRVMRRDYGSLLPSLIDQPDNAATRVRVYAATAGALMRWEPRLRLERVELLSGLRPGQVVLELRGYLLNAVGIQPVGLQVDLTRIGATP